MFFQGSLIKYAFEFKKNFLIIFIPGFAIRAVYKTHPCLNEGELISTLDMPIKWDTVVNNGGIKKVAHDDDSLLKKQNFNFFNVKMSNQYSF